jgi:predicted dehydrogenase
MLEKLRVGVIGCGAIAQIMHIPYLIEHERFEMVSLCDTFEPTLNAVGSRFQVNKRYTNWNELLSNDDLDAVVICHAGSHRDSIIDALDAGKHVFVEKPLAWNLREAQEVVARAENSDRIVQVGYHKLYDPAVAYAKQQIEAMQDIGFARISMLHPANELGYSPYRLRYGDGIREGHHNPGSWQQQLEGQLAAFSGGDVGPLVDEALGTRKDNPELRLAYGIITVSFIHQVYMMFDLLGEPEDVIITDIWRDGFSIHSIVQYPDDMRCTLDWHFLSHLKDYREEYAIFGNHDRVYIHFPSPYFRNFPSPVTIQGGDGELSWEKRVTVSHAEAFENELLAFYENVTNNQSPATTVHDALKHAHFIQEMIDAVRLTRQ